MTGLIRTRDQERLPMKAPRRSGHNALLAKVHVAKKQLALTDEDYRAIIRRAAGRNSAGECSAQQLDAVLREMTRLGWQGRTKPKAAKPIIRMIYAVWRDLSLHISDSSETALRAFVARQTKTPSNPQGVSAPEFLDVAQATKVLEGLKAWLGRERAKGATS